MQTVEDLCVHTKPNDPLLLYWSQASVNALVLGFSQKEYRESLSRNILQLPVHIRMGGGGLVIVGEHLLSLDILIPENHMLYTSRVLELYQWLGNIWLTTLRRLGILCQLWTYDESMEVPSMQDFVHNPSICYASVSPYEVIVDDRKLVGFDMVRKERFVLLQAGILLHWEHALLAQVLSLSPEMHSLLAKKAVGLYELHPDEFPVTVIIRCFEDALYASLSQT